MTTTTRQIKLAAATLRASMTQWLSWRRRGDSLPAERMILDMLKAVRDETPAGQARFTMRQRAYEADYLSRVRKLRNAGTT